MRRCVSCSRIMRDKRTKCSVCIMNESKEKTDIKFFDSLPTGTFMTKTIARDEMQSFRNTARRLKKLEDAGLLTKVRKGTYRKEQKTC